MVADLAKPVSVQQLGERRPRGQGSRASLRAGAGRSAGVGRLHWACMACEISAFTPACSRMARILENGVETKPAPPMLVPIQFLPVAYRVNQ